MNLFAATPTVIEPSAIGVNTAVYTVDEEAVKLPRLAPFSVMSASTKSLVASDAVKVRFNNASLVVAPSTTCSPSPLVAVMAMVGLLPS